MTSHKPISVFSYKSETAGGGTHLIKPRCTLSISSLALMFVAFVWLETFGKFPALCMARVGFVSPWLGSKHRALALLPRRREEWFRLQGERERRRAGHRHTRLQGGAGAGPGPGPGGRIAPSAAPPAELRLGLGLPAPPYRKNQLARDVPQARGGSRGCFFQCSLPIAPCFCAPCSVVSVGLWAVTRTSLQLT